MNQKIEWEAPKDFKGYNGNPQIKKSKQKIEWTPQLIAEWIKCKEDPKYFIETYIQIISLDDGIVPFKLRPYQVKFVDTITQHRNTIISTCRQCGKTTTMAGIVLHYILFNEHKTVAILANKEDTARIMYDAMQLAYTHLPGWIQQGVQEWNKTSLELENGSKVIACATSMSAIRGKAINMLVIDEAARIEQWDEFQMSVMPTISSGKTTKIVLISTPNGLNYFYSYWEKANSNPKKNDFMPISVHWKEVPGRDEAWKEFTLKNDCNGDPDKFAQEYENQFLGSSGTLIAGWKLKELLDNHMTPIRSLPQIKQYYQPIKDHKYVIVADVSEGKGLDYSAFHVVDVSQVPYQQVAVFRDNFTTPKDYADFIHQMAIQYNRAYVLVEANAMGGEVLNILYWEFEYENMFWTQSNGRAGMKVSGGFGAAKSNLGLKTSQPTKALGCSSIKLLVESNTLVVNDYMTCYEFATFSKEGASYKAEEGKTDDLVMGLVLFGWLTNQQMFKDMTDLNALSLIRDKSKGEIEEEIMLFGLMDDGSSDSGEAEEKGWKRADDHFESW